MAPQCQTQQWDYGLWKPFSLVYDGISYCNTAQIHTLLTFVTYLSFYTSSAVGKDMSSMCLFLKRHTGWSVSKYLNSFNLLHSLGWPQTQPPCA